MDLPGQHGLTPPGSEKPKKRGLIWLVLLLIIASIAGYAVWRAGHPIAPQNVAGNVSRRGLGGGPGRGAALGPVPVIVTKVTRSSIPVYLNGLGNVSAFYTVTVKSRVDGQIMKIHFNEGDLVKEGQVLFEIDPRPYQVQLEAAQGTLARDQAILNEARIDLDRYRAAFDKNAIAKQQLDDQVEIVAQDEGTVKQDVANADNAKLQLIYANVTAPITGVLGLRLVDPGNIIHATDTTGMIVITQLQPIAVLFTIPEDSLPQVTQRLRAGMHLPVDAYNRDNSRKLASGKLVTLDNQIDNTTGTSKLKAVFDNKDNVLFPQQFVNMRLLVDTLTDQLVVPNVAIQNGQQGSFVYVVDNRSRVHLKTVQVGITTDTSTDILGGLSEGDQVVIDGTDRLVDGAPVRVRRLGDLASPSGPDGGGRGQGSRGGSKRGEAGSKGSDGGSKGGGGNFRKDQRGGPPQ
jgi:multidrug efflux system membrane fusion protein